MAHHVLVGGVGADVREVLRHGLAGDGHAVAMEQAGVQEHLEQRLEAADAHEVGHVVFAAGLEVRQHRDLAADAFEVFEGDLDARGVADGDEVQDGVRRTAEGDHGDDRVLDRLLGDDVQRTDVLLEQVEHGLAGACAVDQLVLGVRELRGAVGQAQAHGFDGRGHGVGGVHAAARAFARDGALLDLLELGVIDLLRGVLADGFEDGDDVGGLALMQAGDDGAAVDEHGGAVHAGHRHDAAGHVLVAAADGDEAVEAFGAGHGFDGVRDDLTRDERIAHAGGAHRDAVGNGDGAENHRFPAGRVGALGGFGGQAVDVHVAGGDHGPGRGDADDGLLEVGVVEAHRPEHRSAGGAIGAIDDGGGVLAGVLGSAHGL